MSTTKRIEVKHNFTKSWFKFPITLYIEKELHNNSRMMEELGLENLNLDEPEGAVGLVECHPEDILYIHDSFSRPRTIDDVKANGFDNTCVIMRSGEIFNCVWDRKTFKEKLNAHVEKAEEENATKLKAQLEEVMKNMEAEHDQQEQEEKKVPWWRKLRK